MSKYEIRRKNLITLIKERSNGVTSAFARAIEKDPSYVARLTYPEGKSGKKNIGDDLIEAITKGFELPHGWLDINHDLDQAPERKNDYGLQQTGLDYGHLNYIKKYNETGGSMGRGIILSDQPGQITNLVVTDEWINKNVPSNTGKKNLGIVTGFGDSMKGMFNPGDPLLVDTGVTSCDHDGVYFFRIGAEGYVKKLQRIPHTGIRVISKNPDYETWTITEDMDFEVLAKVLIVWKSEHF